MNVQCVPNRRISFHGEFLNVTAARRSPDFGPAGDAPPPIFAVDSMRLIEWLPLIGRAGLIAHVRHPAPQPERDAGAIRARLRANPA